MNSRLVVIFSFTPLNISFHSPLLWMVFYEKSSVIIFYAPVRPPLPWPCCGFFQDFSLCGFLQFEYDIPRWYTEVNVYLFVVYWASWTYDLASVINFGYILGITTSNIYSAFFLFLLLIQLHVTHFEFVPWYFDVLFVSYFFLIAF